MIQQPSKRRSRGNDWCLPDEDYILRIIQFDSVGGMFFFIGNFLETEDEAVRKGCGRQFQLSR